MILNKLDLDEIGLKVKSKVYKSVEDFVTDFDLWRYNCYTCHLKDEPLLKNCDDTIQLLNFELNNFKPYELFFKDDSPEEKTLFINNGLILAKEEPSEREKDEDEDSDNNDE